MTEYEIIEKLNRIEQKIDDIKTMIYIELQLKPKQKKEILKELGGHKIKYHKSKS